ncbi:double-strand break repair helicase AddA [Pseudotabrizicola sp. L79]|uniref:double-strand break repair helicase AddA n=1 Tax=Pseudotabrizicola sp. L79 TaxID=3118402 RepID=UPI002F93D258
MTQLHDASLAQIAAARPDVSTWLSANAGSGKTRVLTDRVARLLLNGVQPQHILCLTYTKAAATEMQNRLFKRLGVWAMKPDAALREDLAELGEGADLSPDRLALARQLFARAIETPGGLRIQTIHSFCATLLRRYPLEAGVSPGFAEMDDRTARALRDDILQDMADRLAPDAVAEIASLYPAEGIESLVVEICSNAPAFAEPLSRDQAFARFGLPPDDSPAHLLADVFLGAEADLLARVSLVLEGGSSSDQKHAARFRALDLTSPDERALQELESMLLFGESAKAGPYAAKIDAYSSKAVRQAMGDDLDRLHQLMMRVESARPRRLGIQAAQHMLTLHRFARLFLAEYESRKAAQGLLDFDDLIRRAGRLLNDPALAAWVLFRLDGGIDHILVDEAQDTSPQQWEVVERLAAEFTAGAGARAEARTLFVVGDKKQSIYSFQGADLSAFDAKHGDFGAKFAEVGQPMQDRSLDYSFRSARAVLQVVDATFGDAFPSALGAAPRHLAFFDALPGRVDLWPLIPKADKTKDENGWDPVDLISEDHHSVQLAQQIADEIKAMVDSGVQIVDERQQTRPVRYGDFLILVQRRAELFSQIIRACKQRGLAIAGADRLKLGEELAVKDLKALLAFLATPEDDLSLATALRSPLFGWTEDQLYRLARPRKGFLWEALRSSAEAETLAVLNDLRNTTDFLRPYELLERVLTQHNGRERLLTRLGPEAEDGIDELLTQALVYEQTDVPSLTGFLVWLEGDEVEVKRQLGGEGDSIRVMTVHGAKGLEANIVILPDTTDRANRDRAQVYLAEDRMALWKPSGDQKPDEIATIAQARKQKTHEESLRLLYVALTRARSWLIVAGAGDAKTDTSKGAKPRAEWCWYLQVQAGLQALGGGALPGGRVRHETGVWPGLGEKADDTTDLVALPDWATGPAPDLPRDLPSLSPSDLGGAKALPGEGDEGEIAKARGTALHSLLEHLPATDPAIWADVARSVTPEGMDSAALLAEAAGVLADTTLAPLFHPDSLAEVAVTGQWNGRRVVGAIDRLLVMPDRVLAVDFKSNRVVPDHPHQVPEGILRQMAAYAHVLQQIYPGKAIETAILWTATPKLMRLDPDIVTAALGRATIS